LILEIEINTSRLTIEELKQKLKDYDIDTTDINDRVVLAGILQSRLDDVTLERNKGGYLCLQNCNYIYSNLFLLFFFLFDLRYIKY
jgi:hypothetical protein